MFTAIHVTWTKNRILSLSVLLLTAFSSLGLGGCIGAASGDSTKSTAPNPQSTVTISNVQTIGATISGVQVSWSTNVAADSQVDYGATENYGTSTPVNQTMVTSHQTALAGLTARTLYHYRVRSTNANNNTAVSGDATFATTGDTAPPTVSVTAPTNGATVSNTVAVTANASDNIGVASVQFQLDGANLGAALTAAPYIYSWDTTKANNSSHTVKAIAKDDAGNTGTSGLVTVTVNNGQVFNVANATVPDSKEGYHCAIAERTTRLV